MTRLVKLRLKNFKSFKKAEIPLGTGFTAIVGSNGSGKSNTLDAILFVLGITSLKALRAGKLVDLINNTCKENYAKVDLIIKNEDKEYEISRMIDKQGKSVYRLNGKRTTLGEISSLLLELGIDVTGHNIVTQGDIMKVIQMNPLQRREIIDDVAGLSEFDEKKSEAIKELDKVDSRIKEATIILNERTVFLQELEQEMLAAKEFEGLEKEKKQLKATVIGRELYSIEKREKEILDEIKNLEKELEEDEKNVGSMRTEIVESKRMSADLNKKIIKASEETYSKLGKDFEEKKALLNLEKEKLEMKQEVLVKSSEKLEENKNELEKNNQEKKSLFERKKINEHKLKEMNSEIEDAFSKKNGIEDVVKTQANKLSNEEKNIDGVNKELEESRKTIFDLEVFIKQWEKQKEYNHSRLVNLKQEENNFKKILSEIKEKKDKIKQYSGNRDLEEDLKISEISIEEMLGEMNRAEAIASTERKAVELIKKALSNCPTCNAELETNTKNKIIAEKTITINKMESEAKNLLQKVSKEKENIKHLKEKLGLIARLGAETEQEDSVKKKLLSIENEIKTIVAEGDEKSIETRVNERNKLNEKIKQLISKRENLKEKIEALRSQNIFSEYSTLSKKIETLLHNKGVLDSELNEINSRINSGIDGRDKVLIKENDELEREIKLLNESIQKKHSIIIELENYVKAKDAEMENAKKNNSVLIEKKENVDNKAEKLEKNLIDLLSRIKKVESRINEFSVEKGKIEVRHNDLQEEMKEFEGIEQVHGKEISEIKDRLIEIEKRIATIGAVNMKAMDNFNELKKEVDDIQEKSNLLANERLAVLDMIDKIEVKRTNVFMDCFNEINKNFTEMFYNFFNGEGNLKLSNPQAPLESGLEIDARHKGANLQSIDAMSGGEKTLTALAFMFAIQLYSPAPFYAFDEADAALDKENSLKMSKLIKMISKKSQFVAITHNDTLTKQADQIVGVALSREKSSVIGLKLKAKDIQTETSENTNEN